MVLLLLLIFGLPLRFSWLMALIPACGKGGNHSSPLGCQKHWHTVYFVPPWLMRWWVSIITINAIITLVKRDPLLLLPEPSDGTLKIGPQERTNLLCQRHGCRCCLPVTAPLLLTWCAYNWLLNCNTHIFYSFNNIDLLCSISDDYCMPQHRG